MNNLKPNTSGIDCEIKSMQTDIYDGLKTQFPNLVGYGRVYRNETSNGVIPETFVLNTNDYQEVYFDSSKDLGFGFIDGQKHSSEDGIVFNAPVKLFVWGDLSKISTTDRQDSELQRQLAVLLKETYLVSDNKVTIEKGVKNVFSGFKTDGLNASNMHPYHLFSLNFELSYQLTKKCE